jgi:sterol 24-C-methyltransferase
MKLSRGMKVLDVGCGVGGPARRGTRDQREIAHFTDAQIIGLNNKDFRIQRANKYTKKGWA